MYLLFVIHLLILFLDSVIFNLDYEIYCSSESSVGSVTEECHCESHECEHQEYASSDDEMVCIKFNFLYFNNTVSLCI